MMQTHTATLCEQALSLPKEDREYLLQRLLDSFEGEAHQNDDEALSPDWEAELRRRVAEIESGQVETIPAEQVHAHVRETLRNVRRVSS